MKSRTFRKNPREWNNKTSRYERLNRRSCNMATLRKGAIEKMNELEKIFYMYMSDKEKDSEEIVMLDEEIGTYMKQIALKREEYSHLEKLMVNNNVSYEKQGFMNGFRYAVKLLAPIL